MTDQQINAAIAEACGIVGKDQYGPLYQTPEGWVVDCPKFATDLNAMHLAEHKLLYVDLCNYLDGLISVSSEAALAPARKRAEVFLRTLGKWEEVQND